MAYPILYEGIVAGTVPQHNGLGVLSDCISCRVEQERNGIYELTMEYPANGIHAEEIAKRRVLKIKPNFSDDPQLFRINRITKTMNGKFTVYANHISYDLSGNVIASGETNSAAAAVALLNSVASGYTLSTDKTVSANFKITEPSSVRSWFGGKTGSFLDVFGSTDIKYNNFNIQFLLHAGEDRGITISYGKNLLELSQEIEDTLYTHVMCFYKNQQNESVITGNKVATGLSLDVEKCLVVDRSSNYQQTEPTVQQLTQDATNYINSHNLTTPSNNIKLDFEQSDELNNRVDLCDEVTVYYEALGIARTKVKCIRVVWDCLKEKYTETEFGDAKTNLAESFVTLNKDVNEKPSTTEMQNAVNNATQQITGNLGGYVVLHDSNGDGEPDEILIMNTDSIETATNVWRFNKNGLGHSNSGYDGQYGLAMTGDGAIVADRITTGILNANLLKAGVISDAQGNSTIDMQSGQASLHNLKARNGLYLVDDNGNVRGYFKEEGVGEAHFALVDSSNNPLAQMFVYPSLGGAITIDNINHKEVGRIDTNANGGRLYLNDKNGNPLVFISNSSGGAINLYDENGNSLFSLFNSSGGVFNLYNDDGNAVLSLWSPSGNKDGAVHIKDSSGTNNIAMYGGDGSITCVSLHQTSSQKVKKNIKKMKDAPEILKLEAKEFDYKKETLGTNKRGFIAEEVAEVLPNLVTGGEVPAIDYIGMIPYLQEILKDHEKRILKIEKKEK